MDEWQRKRAEFHKLASETAKHVAHLLQQKYVKHEDGVWWLWTLGRPIRPLTSTEVKEAQERGDIYYE